MAGNTGGKCSGDKPYCSILVTNLHVLKSIYVLNRMCPTKVLADLPYTSSDGDKFLCRTLNKSKDAFCDTTMCQLQWQFYTPPANSAAHFINALPSCYAPL